LVEKKGNLQPMEKPTVVSLHIAPGARQPTVAVNEVHAVPGKGLAGDRYFNQTGTFSTHPAGDNELTLIEIEAIDALRGESKVELDPGEARRNIVTRAVALNHLVGREFRIGTVSLRGIRLCEPCSHLESLTKPGVKSGLVHRGGLRAQVLTEGAIRVGDKVCEA
jgi:MOSC domain-containing protein YiiM